MMSDMIWKGFKTFEILTTHRKLGERRFGHREYSILPYCQNMQTIALQLLYHEYK